MLSTFRRTNAVSPRGFALLALGAAGLLSPAALAAPGEPEKLVARELMAEGRARRDAGNLAGALESFSRAHAIMRVPTTLLETAKARADLGQLVEAAALLGELQGMPPRPQEPAPFTAARQRAAELAKNLAERIPSLRLRLPGVAADEAAEVWVDGQPRPDCRSECSLNPGHHQIVARKDAKTARAVVMLVERESRAVELQLQAPEAPPPYAPPSGPDAPAGPPARPADSPAFASSVPALSWGLGAAGLVGIGTGIGLGLSAVSRRDELRESCAPSCAASSVDEVRDRAFAANVALGVGAAAAVGAVVSYFVHRASSVSVHADVSASGGFVALGTTL